MKKRLLRSLYEDSVEGKGAVAFQEQSTMGNSKVTENYIQSQGQSLFAQLPSEILCLIVLQLMNSPCLGIEKSSTVIPPEGSALEFPFLKEELVGTFDLCQEPSLNGEIDSHLRARVCKSASVRCNSIQALAALNGTCRRIRSFTSMPLASAILQHSKPIQTFLYFHLIQNICSSRRSSCSLDFCSAISSNEEFWSIYSPFQKGTSISWTFQGSSLLAELGAAHTHTLCKLPSFLNQFVEEHILLPAPSKYASDFTEWHGYVSPSGDVNSSFEQEQLRSQYARENGRLGKALSSSFVKHLTFKDQVRQAMSRDIRILGDALNWKWSGRAKHMLDLFCGDSGIVLTMMNSPSAPKVSTCPPRLGTELKNVVHPYVARIEAANVYVPKGVREHWNARWMAEVQRERRRSERLRARKLAKDPEAFSYFPSDADLQNNINPDDQSSRCNSRVTSPTRTPSAPRNVTRQLKRSKGLGTTRFDPVLLFESFDINEAEEGEMQLKSVWKGPVLEFYDFMMSSHNYELPSGMSRNWKSNPQQQMIEFFNFLDQELPDVLKLFARGATAGTLPPVLKFPASKHIGPKMRFGVHQLAKNMHLHSTSFGSGASRFACVSLNALDS
jgi:hypothetical protein